MIKLEPDDVRANWAGDTLVIFAQEHGGEAVQLILSEEQAAQLARVAKG